MEISELTEQQESSRKKANDPVLSSWTDLCPHQLFKITLYIFTFLCVDTQVCTPQCRYNMVIKHESSDRIYGEISG